MVGVVGDIVGGADPARTIGEEAIVKSFEAGGARLVIGACGITEVGLLASALCGDAGAIAGHEAAQPLKGPIYRVSQGSVGDVVGAVKQSMRSGRISPDQQQIPSPSHYKPVVTRPTLRAASLIG